jgi:hypothetical protein
MYPCTSRSDDTQDAGSCGWNAKEWRGGIKEYDRGEKNNENEKCEFYTLLKIF